VRSRGKKEVELPDSITITDQAKRELAKMGGKMPAAVATLLEAMVRRSKDQHQVRENEALPVGKGRALRAIRVTYERSEYRLIYMQVRHARADPTPSSTRVVVAAATRRPVRFVGLLAWRKNQPRVGHHAATAWSRSEDWLHENPQYERI
jgi:hypothetical protein